MQPVPYEYLKLFFSQIGYTPSPEQQAVHEQLLLPARGIVEETGESGAIPRVVVVGGGEQGGKSLSAGNHCFGRVMLPDEFGDRLIWLTGVEYKDCKQEFDYLVRAGVAMNVLKDGDYSTGKDGPWEVRFPITGSVVKTLTSADSTNLSREAPNGIVMCEPGRQTLEAYETMLRRVSLGDEPGWLLVCGTFEQSARWYPHLWNEGQGDNAAQVSSFSIPTYSNRKRFPGGERNPRFRLMCQNILSRRPVDGEAIIMERYYGQPRKTHGMVFWEFNRSLHVKDYATYVPGIEVELAVDPGYANAFAVLFIQVVQDQIRIFDEIYVTETHGSDIITDIKNHHSYPDVQKIVMDVAVKQHGNAQDSAYETWMRAFSPDGIAISGRYVKVEEGIRRTHDKLGVDRRSNTPFLVINPAARMTIWEFEEGYRYRVQGDTNMVVGEKPLDQANHAMKALAYWIVDHYGYGEGPRAALPRNFVSTPAYERGLLSGRHRSYAGSR